MDHPTPPTRLATGHRHAGRRSARWRSAVAVLGAAVLATTAGPASATTVETTHFAGTLHEPGLNPCTGAPGTFDVTFSGVSHTSTNADGMLHHVATVHGTETFDPTDPGLASYTGRFTARDGQNGGPGQTITATATFHDTLTGSDGSKIQDRGVFHITTNADGSVSSSLDRFTLTCP
jgi:hypothetical protein